MSVAALAATHYISKQGYSVMAIDASQPLCNMATKLLGQNVVCMDFEAIDWELEFDGIWACASLLHVERSKLSAVTQIISNALKPSGILYASFKYGDTERIQDGRSFTDMDEKLIKMLFDNVSGVTLEEIWVTEDRRLANINKWINIFWLVKTRRFKGYQSPLRHHPTPPNRLWLLRPSRHRSLQRLNQTFPRFLRRYHIINI